MQDDGVTAKFGKQARFSLALLRRNAHVITTCLLHMNAPEKHLSFKCRFVFLKSSMRNVTKMKLSSVCGKQKRLSCDAAIAFLAHIYCSYFMHLLFEFRSPRMQMNGPLSKESDPAPRKSINIVAWTIMNERTNKSSVQNAHISQFSGTSNTS